MGLFTRANEMILHAARLVLASVALGLASCASEMPPATYYGVLTYPATEVCLRNGLLLKHKAGPPCNYDDESRPKVGVCDSMRSFSTYVLLDGEKKLCEVPSGLSDAKYGGIDFEEYYRKYDRLGVFQSETGKTILISEDRSPTFPRLALLLVQQDQLGAWHYSQLNPPYSDPIPPSRGPVFGHYHDVVGITDSSVTFRDGHRVHTERISKLQVPDRAQS